MHPQIKEEMAKKSVTPAPKQDQKGLEEALSKSEQFFENNKKTIFGALIAIIVIIAGGMLYNAKVAQPRQIKASEAIFPGESYFINGDYETALNGDAYGFEGFEALADKFKGTKANKLANLYAGLCYAQLDSMDIAEKYLSKFKGSDQMVSPAALGALANCYATNGQVARLPQHLRRLPRTPATRFSHLTTICRQESSMSHLTSLPRLSSSTR